MSEERAKECGAARHLGELRGDAVGQTLALLQGPACVANAAQGQQAAQHRLPASRSPLPTLGLPDPRAGARPFFNRWNQSLKWQRLTPY